MQRASTMNPTGEDVSRSVVRTDEEGIASKNSLLGQVNRRALMPPIKANCGPTVMPAAVATPTSAAAVLLTATPDDCH